MHEYTGGPLSIENIINQQSIMVNVNKFRLESSIPFVSLTVA